MSKRSFWFLFITIISLGVFFRLYELGYTPRSLYWDEMAMLVDARSVAETGKDMHGNSWFQSLFISYGDYKLPVYVWFASLAVKLLGASEFALRLPSALAGISTIIVSAYIAMELFFGEIISINTSKFKKDISTQKNILMLSVMFTVAVSPWSILFSRTAFEGHLGQLLLSLSILFVLLSKKKRLFLYVSPLIASLATYTYFSVRYAWVPVFILLVSLMNWEEMKKSILALIKKRKIKQALPIGNFLLFSLFIPLAIFIFSLLPMIRSPLYAASNEFRFATKSVLNMEDWPLVSNKYREMSGNTLLSRLAYHRYVFPIRELLTNYSDNLSFDYLFMSGDPNLRHGTGHHGLFLFMFLPVFVVGIYHLSKNYRLQFLLLFFWWIVAILPASVPDNTPHALRSLNALVPVSIIIGFGLYQLVSRMLKQKMKTIYFVCFTLLSAVSIYDFSIYYFIQYPRISAKSWQNGYKEIAEKIDYHKDSVDEVFVAPFDDRFYLWPLGYGSYSSEEIQSWESEQYQFEKFDNIKFTHIDWLSIDKSNKTVLIVGQTESVERYLEPIARKKYDSGYIPNEITEDEYSYIIYKN